MEDYYDEQEIDLLDLLYKIAIHLKKIIIISIISSILFGAYSAIKNTKDNSVYLDILKNKPEIIEKYKDDFEEVEDYKADLDKIANLEEEALRLTTNEYSNEFETIVDYLNYCNSLDKDINNLKTSADNKYKKFDDIQKFYLENTKTISDFNNEKVNTIIKYLLIGLFVGLFLACGYFCVIIMLNGKMHTSEDLKYLNINNLGTICTNKDNNAFYKKLFKREYLNPSKQINLIDEKIKVIKKVNNIKNVVIVTTLDQDKSTTYINKLKKSLGIKNLYYKVNECNDFIKDKNNKYVVLAESLEESNIKDIIKFVDLSKQLKIDILGSVVIDNN